MKTFCFFCFCSVVCVAGRSRWKRSRGRGPGHSGCQGKWHIIFLAWLFRFQLRLSIYFFKYAWFQEIYEAGEARWGTDEVKFLTVLCVRNRNHLLRGTMTAYALHVIRFWFYTVWFLSVVCHLCLSKISLKRHVTKLYRHFLAVSGDIFALIFFWVFKKFCFF